MRGEEHRPVTLRQYYRRDCSNIAAPYDIYSLFEFKPAETDEISKRPGSFSTGPLRSASQGKAGDAIPEIGGDTYDHRRRYCLQPVRALPALVCRRDYGMG